MNKQYVVSTWVGGIYSEQIGSLDFCMDVRRTWQAQGCAVELLELDSKEANENFQKFVKGY